MAGATGHPARTRHWAVILPLAAGILIVLYTVLSMAVSTAYLITGRVFLAGPGHDWQLTTASLPQVASGQVPPLDIEYLPDLPPGLRWLCAAPSLLYIVVLVLVTVLVVMALRRLAAGISGPALARPWQVMAAVLILGGLAHAAADTVAVQVLREQYHPTTGFGPAVTTAVFAIPWLIIAFGLLAAAIAAALNAHTAHHGPARSSSSPLK